MSPSTDGQSTSVGLEELLGLDRAQQLLTRLEDARNQKKVAIPDEKRRYEGIFVVRDYNAVPEISVMLIDIDGTLTGPDGKITEQVAWEITNLATKDIYSCFITGRDVLWLDKNAIGPFQKFFRFPQVQNQLRFYAESGCMRVSIDEQERLSIDSPRELLGHPILDKDIRGTLADLSYNPQHLRRYKGELKDNESIAYDANDEAWVINNEEKAPPLHKHIWSLTKECIATYEIIRSPGKGQVPRFDQRPFIKIVNDRLKQEHLDKVIQVEEVGTALNLVPKLNGRALGKGWAAGIALQQIYQHQLRRQVAWNAILSRTLAFGDGKADLEFTAPMLPPEVATALRERPPQFVFVGDPEKDLPTEDDPQYALRKNIVIQTTGNRTIVPTRNGFEFTDPRGAVTFSAVVNWLLQWDRFRPFTR